MARMLGGGMCAGVSLRDTPSPLYQDRFGAGSLARKRLPGTAHRPSWLDKRIAVQARPHFSTSTSSHMLFPAPGISSPCTKLLLVLQGPAQMSPPPPCALNFPQPGVMETPGSHTPWGESPVLPCVHTNTRTPRSRRLGSPGARGRWGCRHREAPGEGRAEAPVAEVQASGSAQRGGRGGVQVQLRLRRRPGESPGLFCRATLGFGAAPRSH